MPNVGTLDFTAKIDYRKAEASARQFQKRIDTLGKGGRNGRNSAFGAITADTRDFDNSLGKATNRVVAFGAAAAIFTTISRVTSQFAESIVEVDQSLAKININLGQSSEGLKKFGANLFNIARDTGQTFDVAAKAAEELARQGLSAEETSKRLKDALILSRIAGLDSAAAVDTLTAAINSFNKEALTSTEVVNKFAAVDTKFAVSSKDLAEAVSRVGSTAQSAGVGINELIGLVTSLQQTTARGGATIGNGLKTIFTRIQAAPETVAALEGVGVAIKNTDGSLRDAISILRDYGRAREKIGEVERASLDRTVAGTFQINILKAALGDLSKEYSVYGNAVNTANNATDEAIRKNEQLNATLASLINSTAVSIKQLFAAVGGQDLGPLFAGVLKSVEKVRGYLSGDTGSSMGEALGDGILQGLSNVLGGPALISLIIILTNAFKRVVTTIAGEAKGLLAINSAVQARASVQKQINILVSQANQLEGAQLSAARTAIEQKTILLRIQERLNQELLLGTQLQNQLIIPGRLGIGSRPNKQLGKGSIPSFANPIASAVAREKAAGVPANQIYVDKDPRVANFANPMGLLVANKRDEPLGGFQGVNRVINQGGDPKKAGMIPNFAPPFTRGEFVKRGQFSSQSEIDALNKLFLSLKGLDSNRIKKVATEIRTLTKDFNQSAKNLVTGSILSAQKLARSQEGQIISDDSRFAPFTPTPSGTIDYSRAVMDRNIARKKQPSPSNRPFGPAFPINPDLLQRLQARDQAIRYSKSGIDPTSNQYEAPIGPITRGQSLARAVNRGAELRRSRLAEAARRRQTLNNRTLAASFVLPFASGFIPDAPGGTDRGIASGIGRGAAQGAGIGGLFGPKGLAVGAVIGALVGGLGKFKKSVEELNVEFDGQIARRNQESEAISRAIQLQEELNEALKQGADESVIDKLDKALRDTRSNIQSGAGRAVLDISDPKQQSKAAFERQDALARQNAITEIKRLLLDKDNVNEFTSSSGDGPSGNDGLASAIKKAFTDDVVGKITDGQILELSKIAAKSFDPKPVFASGAEGVKAEVDAQLEAAAAFKEAAEILAPLAALAGISEKDIQKDTINSFALAVVKAIAGKRSDVADSEASNKLRKAAGGRLTTGSFLSSPNLDVIGQAALTGRNPNANRGEKAQAQFDFFNELKNAGGIGEAALKSDPNFKKAEAGVQAKNVTDTIIKFLQSNNPGVGTLRDGRGNPNLTGIERSLELVAKSGTANSELAKLMIDLVPKLRNTLSDAKVNSVGFTEGVSGITPGADYGKFNQITKKAFKRRDENGNVVLTQVPKAPAIGRNGSISQETLDKLPAEETRKIDVNVNVDGALKLIADGMDPGLAVAINTKVNQAVIDATAEYFKGVQPQLNAIKVQLASLNGKPLPPSSPSEMKLPSAAAIRFK